MSGEVDRWMAMLNERHDECVATLDRDLMAVEVIFRRRDDDGEWLYWFSLQVASAPENADAVPEAERHAIDHDHITFSRRCKERGWEELEPQLLLLPAPVCDAVLTWAKAGASAAPGP